MHLFQSTVVLQLRAYRKILGVATNKIVIHKMREHGCNMLSPDQMIHEAIPTWCSLVLVLSTGLLRCSPEICSTYIGPSKIANFWLAYWDFSKLGTPIQWIDQ